jgi:hypothetical protein
MNNERKDEINEQDKKSPFKDANAQQNQNETGDSIGNNGLSEDAVEQAEAEQQRKEALSERD